MRKLCLTLFLTVFSQGFVFSQNLSIRNFTQEDYGSLNYITSPQNWDVEQDTLGRMYISNNSGVLVFDGSSWLMVNGSEDHKFSVVKNTQNIIYAGGRDRFGVLTSDSTGRVIFNPILQDFEREELEIGEIKGLSEHESFIFAKTENGLLQYDGLRFSFYKFSSRYHEILTFNNAIILQDDHGNLLAFEDQRFDTLFSIGDKLNSEVMGIAEISGTRKLLFTNESGVFDINDETIQPWNSILNERLVDSKVLDIIHINNQGLIGISTEGEGILIIDYNGDVLNSIDIDDGLVSNLCYSLFLDKNEFLWGCFDNGLSRIEYPIEFDLYNSITGLPGVLQGVVVDHGVIYAGSTNGLYYQKEQNAFRSTSFLGEVWDIRQKEEVIFIASTQSISQIINKKINLVAEVEARAITFSSNKARIWVGLENGLGWMENQNGNWVWGGRVSGIDHEIRTIAEESDTILWASYEQISKIAINKTDPENSSVETMTSEHGFSEDFYVTESYKIRDKIYFGTGLGLYRFNSHTNTFDTDSSFGFRFTDGMHDAWALAEDVDGNVWVTSNRTTGKLIFEDDKMVKWDTLPFARLKSTDVWRTVPYQDKVYFCTTNGLYEFDKQVNKDYTVPYHALITRVDLNQDSTIAHLSVNDSKNVPVSLAYENNDIRFSYTATSYNYNEELQYSYLLDGYDKNWSSWKPENVKEYTNLPHGDYTFKVKAKNLYGIDSKTAAYTFSIAPPWYRTYWAYAIFFLIFVSILFVLARIQRVRLFKRQQAKIKIQQKKLKQEREISNKLRLVDKLKDEFLANTSHELRTPLNGIIGISESLYEEPEHINEEEAKNNLSMVIASGKRLASMVDSILDYSKLKTQNLEIKKKPVDLKSIANLILEMSRPLVSKKEISLINNIPDELPLLEADENRLQQILYNLIGNAIKFTPSGKICISAIPQGKFIEVEVLDDGVGIPEDKLDRIFDSYEQVNIEEDREYIGTGLGLTITKKLVELHNGSISVHSKPGVGSCFKFTIPISSQAISSWIEKPFVHIEDPMPTALIKPSDKAQFNILIVDDEQINRQVLANHLKHEPYSLEMASNGKEALLALEQRHFDLVLLDVMMPMMSGFDVCLKIREKHLISELPVIFITAKDQIIDLVEGLRYGGNDYITKPFSKQEFLARVKTHLNLHKVNDSFFRFVPIEFIQSLGSDSILDVNLGDQTEKVVTVFFSDIREYTTLSEGMTPKDNFEFLNSFLGKMGPVIQDNRGFVLQFLGDGLMSIFLHDPIDAVNASIAMQAKIEEYNTKRESKSKKAIKVGIGIHTGKLILGVIGDKKRMSVNVVSDAVNTASRMEGLTKHYGASIIMSEHTRDGLADKSSIHHRFLGMVKVKGKSNPIKIFEILDGIESEQNRIKIETKETFETGLTHYFNKDFINSAAYFKKVTTRNAHDVSAQMYLELSAKYMVETVPENWSGVETMLLK